VGNDRAVHAGFFPVFLSCAIGSPVVRDRNSRRSRRYSCPRTRAAVTSGLGPLAVSYPNNPSSTQIVVWNDDRWLGGALQFQPPSLNCSRSSRSARRSLASPKYAPIAST